MARLPQPGGDAGSWGSILNDYLSQAHKTDGTLKDDSVGSSQITAGAVSAPKLASGVQASLARADSATQPVDLATKYTKPADGIPLVDLRQEDLDATYAPLGSTSGSTARVVVATGSEVRPGVDFVIWIGGTVQPVNMVSGDLWFSTEAVAPASVPAITATTLSPMYAGVVFSQTITATGSTPLAWSVTSGSLPLGLALNPNTGAITGTPQSVSSYNFTVMVTNNIGSDTHQYTGNVMTEPAPSGPWANRSLIELNRNGTTNHAAAFTPASAGNLLVMIAASGATYSIPSGWTRRLQALNSTELCVFTKTASAGESSFSTTLSAANYLFNAVVYEFPSNTTWVTGASLNDVPSQGTHATISGLTGTNLVISAGSSPVPENAAPTVTAWGGSTTMDVNIQKDYSSNDGVVFSTGYIDNYTQASYAPSAQVGSWPKETVTFAVTT